MTPKGPPPADSSLEGSRLVVADDQEDLLAMMKDMLEMEGYSVRTAPNGKEALDMIRLDPPDIVILDLWMPLMDGFEVCKTLKEDPAYQHLPIIILSATTDRDKKVHGLELGADDFVTKPVDLIELQARIRMILKRTRQGLDANPLTRLPGNHSIQSRISAAIATGKPMAVLYFDLNNFKAYNDVYGYDAGDKVIQATGKSVLESTQKRGNPHDFVGHIGGDDFIVLTTPDRMEPVAMSVIAEFDALVPSFYKEEHRKAGKIIAEDRKGETVEYPLLSIAVGACHNTLKPLHSSAQVSEIGAELKKYAKSLGGSQYYSDRRKD